MEDKKDMSIAKNEVAESAQTEVNLMDDPKQPRGALEDMIQVNTGDSEGGKNISQGAVQADMETSHEVGKTSGELNREASISSDDIVRAGGFGARDDISSFLPVASDSTDFEASLRDAREYEDPQEEICRPGLGWTEPTK